MAGPLELLKHGNLGFYSNTLTIQKGLGRGSEQLKNRDAF